MRFLIFCPASHGGIAEHAHYQARAIVQKDRLYSDLVLLCSSDFLEGRSVDYKKLEVLSSHFFVFSRFAGRFGKMVDICLKILGDQWKLAWEILRRKPDVVLLASYSEYLSPFWICPHLVFARFFGVTYVANLHDPVRDYQVGPKWWHDLSVKLAYLPISVGVVHQRLSPPSPVPTHVKVVEAPVGVYDLQETADDPEAIRAAWGLGRRDSEKLKADLTQESTEVGSEVVFLAFGFVRDNKNLDLVIRALVDNPSAMLVVMGRAQSKKDKPVDFYSKLARDMGVEDRVQFFSGFVPDEKLAGYFAAADAVVLTYDGTFHSQSGVLNIAARARRPVLASAGESPLKDCVQRFRLGVFVQPDDLRALKDGMRVLSSDEWRVTVGDPDWDGYEKFASWEENVTKILEGLGEVEKSGNE